MINLLISILLILTLIGCDTPKKNDIKDALKTTKNIVEKKIIKNEPKKKNINKNNSKTIFYLVGEPFFIQGVKYVPEENYSYSEVGLATFYGKELHNVKTINNDYNKVTELLGRHNTLPLPSIVKVTNLENGLSVTLKIIDRHDDNGSIIQVSRKVSQLLGFYKNKIAKVRIDIISDASKQWKNVTNSMNEPKFNETVSSAPTNKVSVSNLDELDDEKKNTTKEIIPIELGSEPIEKLELYLIVKNFKNEEEIKSTLNDLGLNLKYSSEMVNSKYNLILGPLDNKLANNLVSSFVMKGYKNIKLILE